MIGLIKGDTRSSDYSSDNPTPDMFSMLLQLLGSLHTRTALFEVWTKTLSPKPYKL